MTLLSWSGGETEVRGRCRRDIVDVGRGDRLTVRTLGTDWASLVAVPVAVVVAAVALTIALTIVLLISFAVVALSRSGRRADGPGGGDTSVTQAGVGTAIAPGSCRDHQLRGRRRHPPARPAYGPGVRRPGSAEVTVNRVGAENTVTSCDLKVFVDEAAESVSS
jgi:hypothetical protein